MSDSRDAAAAKEQAEKQQKIQSLVRELTGVIGFTVFEFGLWLVFGTGWACIIGGAALFGLTVLGILRRSST
jgi:hypothetical protein